MYQIGWKLWKGGFGPVYVGRRVSGGTGAAEALDLGLQPVGFALIYHLEAGVVAAWESVRPGGGIGPRENCFVQTKKRQIESRDEDSGAASWEVILHMMKIRALDSNLEPACSANLFCFSPIMVLFLSEFTRVVGLKSCVLFEAL